MNKYCIKCGNDINGMSFCNRCGAKQDITITQQFTFNSFSDGKTIVTLNKNSLTISRPGVLSKFSHGFSGDKTIMYNQITSVQFKAVGVARGYIQFIIPGAKEAKSGILKGKIDENIIYFDSGFNNDEVNRNARIIKETIENYSNNQVQNVTQNIVKQDDNYDKLRKLKKLLEDNIITQEEFETEKKKLLQ